MRKEMCVAVLLVCVLVMSSGCKSGQLKSPTIVQHTISHRLTGAGKVPAISASHGDRIVFRIVDTDDQCFRYNAETVTTPRAEAGLRTRGNPVVELPVTHDESTTAYKIRVTKRAGCTDTDGLEEVEWEIPVRELWNLAFAGGVARHDLIDPRVFLNPGTKDTDSNSTTPEVPGFFVSRNSDADDDFKVEGAAVSHLYLSSSLIRGVSVAPLTFGISIDDDRPSYLLGSSLRFGSRAFLTVGRIFGTRQRLPTALHQGDFTTDANALADLPTRAAESWFVGVSYSFLSSGVADLFRSRIGVPQNVQRPAGTPAPPTPPNPADGPQIKIDPAIAPALGGKITITGKGFQTPEAGSHLVIGPNNDKIASTSAAVTKWEDTKIEFILPASFYKDEPYTATVEVKVGSNGKGKADLTVPKKADPAAITLTPATAQSADERITVTGTGFGADRAATSQLIISTDQATTTFTATNESVIPTWSDTKIVFILPATFAPAAAAMTVKVEVKVGGESKGKADLTIPKKP